MAKRWPSKAALRQAEREEDRAGRVFDAAADLMHQAERRLQLIDVSIDGLCHAVSKARSADERDVFLDELRQVIPNRRVARREVQRTRDRWGRASGVLERAENRVNRLKDALEKKKGT